MLRNLGAGQDTERVAKSRVTASSRALLGSNNPSTPDLPIPPLWPPEHGVKHTPTRPAAATTTFVQILDYSELFGKIFYLPDREESDISEDNEEDYTTADYYQTLLKRKS